jgi:hypothetical protein
MTAMMLAAALTPSIFRAGIVTYTGVQSIDYVDLYILSVKYVQSLVEGLSSFENLQALFVMSAL